MPIRRAGKHTLAKDFEEACKLEKEKVILKGNPSLEEKKSIHIANKYMILTNPNTESKDKDSTYM